MTEIDRIIQRAPNPFDTETFWSGNFWQEIQNPELTVDSIHQDVLQEIEAVLDQVAEDRRSRTLLLEGETGSGKTYLLGRLKRQLQTPDYKQLPRAFFVYIEPFTASDYIWRHILRYTVDSLLETPAGLDKSQLLIWLEGLSELKKRGIVDWLRGERQLFIRKLLETYPSGIYNAQEFFGVLYHLTDSELYPIACEWLRGDDLDDESLRKLGVQGTIDTEDAAQKTLANFGRIADATLPIVLCFDQLDNIARDRPREPRFRIPISRQFDSPYSESQELSLYHQHHHRHLATKCPSYSRHRPRSPRCEPQTQTNQFRPSGSPLGQPSV